MFTAWFQMHSVSRGARLASTLRQSARLYRTATNEPAQFSASDVGKLYEIPKESTDQLAFNKVLPSAMRKQLDTLGECVTMLRRPLLEVSHVLSAARPSFPAIRAVLWGEFGTGKTLTLCQAVHSATTQAWVVVHHKSAMELTRQVREVEMSTHKTGRINDPENAVAILQQFKQQNAHVWKRLAELRTEREYEWTKNEKTAEGRPVTEIVEMGLSAPFLASDCVGGLFRELKRHASAGEVKVLVAVDDANSLWGRTLVKRADGSYAPPTDLTLVQHMRDLIKNDWSNGAVLLVADKKEVSDARDRRTIPRHTPLELFGEAAVDHIEPFVPIECSNYDKAEANNLWQYYVEKRWLTGELARSDVGREQIMHLSAFNPHYYERICAFN